MIYVLGPYRFIDDAYTGPPGWVSGIDLAPIEVQGKAAESRPVGVFACESVPGDDWTVLGEGDPREIHTTTRMRQAFRTGIGYMPQGDTLADLIWDCLTEGADPAGEAMAKPLMPTRRRELELWFGPRVRQEAFAVGKHGHSNRVLDVIRRDFRRQWEADQTHARKVLDFECHKYRLDDWQQFVPSDLRAHVPGRLKHETTITETWPTDGAVTSGQDLSWSILEGSPTVSGGVCSHANNNTVEMRVNSDLSSADHHVLADMRVTSKPVSSTAETAVYARMSSSALTAYMFLVDSDSTPTHRIFKRTSGTFTGLSSAVSISTTANVFYENKGECNGSSITSYFNGVQQASITDSSITGNLRTGIYLLHADSGQRAHCDNFEASDLGGGGGGGGTVGKLLLMGVGG